LDSSHQNYPITPFIAVDSILHFETLVDCFYIKSTTQAPYLATNHGEHVHSVWPAGSKIQFGCSIAAKFGRLDA